jgi:hypothetical protein
LTLPLGVACLALLLLLLLLLDLREGALGL